MEEELRSAFQGIEVKLVESGGGVFDVKFDGRLIFSKKSTKENRFPESGEITRLVEAQIG